MMPKCHEEDAYDDSYLQSLSTEELEVLLEQYFKPMDLFLQEKNPTTEELFDIDMDAEFKDVDVAMRILDILVERDGRTPEERDAETRLQWERFVASNPGCFDQWAEDTATKIEKPEPDPAISISAASDTGRGQTSIGTLTTSYGKADTCSNEQTSSCNKTIVPITKGNKGRSVARTMAASFVAVLLLGGAAVAINPAVFGMIGRWTEETFQIGAYQMARTETSEYQATSQGYQGIVDALAAYQINDSLIPKQLPEGFSYGEVRVNTLPDRIVVLVTDESTTNHRFSLSVTIYNELPENLLYDYEKTDASVANYEVGGIKHYILPNYEQTSISWLNGNCEVNIAGDFTREDAKLMIDSVY